MTVRRLRSALSVCLVAASASAVAAQPNGSPAPTPAAAPAPADPATGTGETVQMAEDEGPRDMEGKDENPDAPRTGDEDLAISAPAPVTRSAYPIQESLRPIVLPQNLSEVSIDPHAPVSPFMGSAALRARYGITSKVQLGLTYVFGGVYDEPGGSEKTGFHPGKTVGIDATVLLQPWIGVRIGVPVHIDSPANNNASGPAVSIALGAPIKFMFGDKFALGGFDDLLNIRVNRFAPTFYQEQQNAQHAANDDTNTSQSAGYLQLAAYGVYQHRPNLAVIGRLGVRLEDFVTSDASSTAPGAGLISFLRVGIQFTPRKFVDLGFSLGFDDLSQSGSFGPAALVAFRI
ncbi:MAG: hypothetical protein ACTHU0_16370, partial [Kofleriaceae bacterium]